MDRSRPAPSDRLASYRAKRIPGATPEPIGVPGEGGAGGVFVVHKHAARRLHYDLRLEMHGVLESWAVPRGPSRDPREKRLAVKVEDHPLEYGDFEGLIPEGNYGAGAVIVWDRGLWIPLDDVAAGWAKGKLLFELRGYKLQGRWTLVKLKKGEKEWLLIKERDALAVSGEADRFAEESILSGLTVEELRDGVDPAAPVREALRRTGAPRRRVRAEKVELMLAASRDQPFSKSGWLFELKLDGFRMLAEVRQGEARLRTRNGRDASEVFPEVLRALRALPFEHLVLDGEVVVHDDRGLPSFERLQRRALLRRPSDIRRAWVAAPATFYAFDLLGFEDWDLRPLSLAQRKELLREVLPPVGPLRYLDHVEAAGEALYRRVTEMGLEGVVAKQAAARYQGGRSRAWLKVRAERTGDFVVVGYTRPQGSRVGFGALHLAGYRGEELVYAGRVGSGFAADELDAVRRALESSRRATPPCAAAPAGRADVWVIPRLVCEVRYKEWTADRLLRQPVFLRFRDDKTPAECRLPDLDEGSADEREPPAVSLAPAAGRPVPEFSNLDKIFFPEDGYTKGDLVAYYREVADWMLPYLRDRPLVMTRFPDGIHGKSFFQKDAPEFAPDWLRRVPLWSDDSGRELRYFVVDSLDALLYVANLASIPLHVWASRVATLEQPDWCVLDLDPGEAPFRNVVAIARALRALCEEIGLPAYVKTTGRSGLHVLVPLGRQCTFEQAKVLGELLARLVTVQLPEIATIARSPARRGGKVYVDYVQNGRGKLIVAPFAVRPLPGAPVSMPLRWSEVTARLHVGRYTIKTAVRRMRTLGADPLRGVLEDRPDLGAALAKLGERVGRLGSLGRGR